jgi:ankyrin repeat protein
MDAIVIGNSDFALVLIEKGASVTYSDSDGVTVITQAAYHGLTAVVEALIKKDVDLTVSNAEGINPLIAAASVGHTDIVKLLLATGGCSINSKDKDGTNALMAAAVRGHKGVVDVLLSNGVDMNSQNADGHSALMFAYNGKNQVQTLLDKYSEYMKESNDTSTKIIKDALQTHVDVVDLLLKNGADITLKDNDGHVALDFDYKQPELIVPTTASVDVKTEL